MGNRSEIVAEHFQELGIDLLQLAYVRRNALPNRHYVDGSRAYSAVLCLNGLAVLQSQGQRMGSIDVGVLH